MSGDPDPQTAGARRGVRRLMALCVLLAAHGSIYPWRFAWPPSLAMAWQHMMQQSSWWTGLGDVVGNIALFTPLGVLGWLLLSSSARPAWLRALLVLAAGLAYAFVLQVVQIFVPERDAAWSDVVWNTVGLALGMLLAAPASLIPLARLSAQPLRLPLTFAALWLLLQCWPLLPALDWQHIKDALKPLLLHPQWRTVTALDAAISLALVGLLLRPLRHRRLWLLALPCAAACGVLLVEGQVLSVPRGVGWIVGVLAAALAWRLSRRTAATLGAALALLWFTFDQLKPFQLNDSFGEFHWLPFAALLQGSLSANTLALAWQLFWQGAVLVLLHSLGARASALALALGLWTLLRESTQTLLPGRTADITPAMLPWPWWLMLPLLQVSLPGAVTKSTLGSQIHPPRHAP